MRGESLFICVSNPPHAQPEMTPREAFQFRNSPDLEHLSLDEAAECVIAHGIIPYPPGIPLIMPGENMGPAVCRAERLFISPQPPVPCTFYLSVHHCRSSFY